MQDIPDFYITGRSIKTKIGKLHPVLVEDYPDFIQYHSVLILDKKTINDRLDDIDIYEDDNAVDLLKSLGLLEFLKVYSEPRSDFHSLYCTYKELFKFCFKDDVFDLIETESDLEDYIELIKRVNNIKLRKPNPNPEIERRNQLKEKLQELKNPPISFEGIFTSIEAITGRDPNKMTVYRFYKLFERIGHVKSYDTTVMYAMMSDKIKVEPWYKDTKIEDTESYLTEDQLNRAKEGQGLQEDL